jgi:hypothetical protein
MRRSCPVPLSGGTPSGGLVVPAFRHRRHRVLEQPAHEFGDVAAGLPLAALLESGEVFGGDPDIHRGPARTGAWHQRSVGSGFAVCMTLLRPCPLARTEWRSRTLAAALTPVRTAAAADRHPPAAVTAHRRTIGQWLPVDRAASTAVLVMFFNELVMPYVADPLLIRKCNRGRASWATGWPGEVDEPGRGSRGSGGGFEGDFVAEGFELADVGAFLFPAAGVGDPAVVQPLVTGVCAGPVGAGRWRHCPTSGDPDELTVGVSNRACSAQSEPPPRL